MIFDIDGLEDFNADGEIDGDDFQQAGIKPGSSRAQEIWQRIDEEAHSDDAVEYARQQGYPDADGWYSGGPLVKGESASGQRDFQFLVDKLHWHDGYPMASAKRIAASVKWRLYG